MLVEQYVEKFYGPLGLIGMFLIALSCVWPDSRRMTKTCPSDATASPTTW
ncbi:hypothetical protein [Streptomyces sp. NPDC127033]